MELSRRNSLKALSVGAAGALLNWGRPAAAQAARKLDVSLLGYSLGIHVPGVAAVRDLLPQMPGYADPKVVRIEQNRVLTQALVSGTTDIGEADPITVFQAVAAGADLKIIGNVYLNTSIVFVANADKVQEVGDLARSGVTVAVNGIGDVSHVMLVGPLLKRGVDLKKVSMLEIGGSGNRVRALLSKRVDAVPVHFDQAAALAKQGNFKVLLKPWQEYDVWITESWAVGGAWLKRPENQRVAVDLMKAVIVASRRANADFAWYLDGYRRHVTLPNAAQTSADELRPVWQGLVGDVKAWPASNRFSVDAYQQLLPVYRAADALSGTVTAEQVVDTRYTEQALRELGG